MNNWIGPIVKNVLNYAMRVLHDFVQFVINTTAYHLGPIQPLSPSTKELHGRVKMVNLTFSKTGSFALLNPF